MNKIIAFISVFCLLFTGCRQEELENDRPADFVSGIPVPVSISVSKQQAVVALDSLPDTRSGGAVNDFQVSFTDADTAFMTRAIAQFNNTWLLQFDADGNCTVCTNLGHVPAEGILSATLTTGEHTTLYLLGNGPVTLVRPATLTDFEGAAYFSEETYTSADMLPYIAKVTDVSVSSDGKLATSDGYDVVFKMKCIAARLSLTCTTDLSGYRITSVVLYDAPQKMYYTYTNPVAEVKATPMAANVVSGDTYTWFIGENLRGNGSSTNQQERYAGKAPASSSFIRITLEAPVGCEATTYDIYPGKDLTANYDIARNWDYAYTTTITKAGASVSSDKRTETETILVDLTAQPSNCYVVEPGKSYKFRIDIRGEEGAVVPSGLSVTRSNTVTRMALLWQDEPELVNSLDYIDASTAVVCFKYGVEGNAVVMGMNNTNTEWSWHFWVIEGGAASLNSYTVNGMDLMDRNMGATASGETSLGAVDFRGLIYEWGRKDPFPGTKSVDASVRKSVYAFNGSNYKIDRSISPSSLSVSILHPDWYIYMNTVDKNSTPYWLNPTNDDLWGYSSDAKTIFDPCPYGWQVPHDHTVWENWDSSNFSWDATNLCGHYGTEVWLPAAGRYNYLDAPLGDSAVGMLDVGTDGYYWSAKPATGGSGGILHFSNAGLVQQENVAQTYGCSIRPVRVK